MGDIWPFLTVAGETVPFLTGRVVKLCCCCCCTTLGDKVLVVGAGGGEGDIFFAGAGGDGLEYAGGEGW